MPCARRSRPAWSGSWRPQDAVVESNRFRLQKPTTDPAFIRFRIQEGIDDHIRYVEGRAPTATVETRDDVGPEALDGVPVFETGVSRATADRFGLALGEVVELLGDPGDPLLGRTPQDAYAFARITGIYEVRDEAADFWLDDPLAIHPVIRALSSEVQLLDAALVVDPAAHASLTGFYGQLGRPLRYTWRYFVDDGAITARAVPGLITAFRRLEVQYPSANVTAGGNTAMRTGLLEILQGFDAEWAAAESIVAVMAVGPALVALATLALVAVLAARRRRATMALARGRGASGGAGAPAHAGRGPPGRDPAGRAGHGRSHPAGGWRPRLALRGDGGRGGRARGGDPGRDGGSHGPRARPGAAAGRGGGGSRRRAAPGRRGVWSSPWPPVPRTS